MTLKKWGTLSRHNNKKSLVVQTKKAVFLQK